MKQSPTDQIVITFVALAAAVLLPASPVHAGKLEAGPNGGKIVGNPPDHAELLLSPTGFLSLTFLDTEKKAAAPGSRTAAVVAQLDTGKKEIPLKLQGDAFVSVEPLPTPEGYTLVIQTRSGPEAKPVNTRVSYNMHVCGGCHLAEYACTCEEH